MMSTIKGEVAAFIADHQVDNFVMTPVTMREISLRTAQEQMLPKVEMERIVDGVLEGCPVYPRAGSGLHPRYESAPAGFDLLPWRRFCHRYGLGL